jgi:hypothetical protein
VSALDTRSTNFLLALMFFGVHRILLGLSLYRSRYEPEVMSLFLMAGSIGYIVHSFASLVAVDTAAATGIRDRRALAGGHSPE